MTTKRLLTVRKRAKRRKPAFTRQEGKKHPRLKTGWRKPKGKHSKLRQSEKARGRVPSMGYRSPRAVRGLSPEGLPPVRVFNPTQLPTTPATVIIAATVGRKKRMQILKKAEELGIKVSNTSSKL